jgi:hypothetical protein
VLPLDLRGRYEVRGAAAVTFGRLVLGAREAVVARWADLGGRWLAELVPARVDGDVLSVAEDKLHVRRSGAHIFLVEDRNRAEFDASAAWVDSDEPGRERGYRAFLKVNLDAYWKDALRALRDPEARVAMLERLALGTLYFDRTPDGSDDEVLVAESAILEGMHHVDPNELVDATLRAGEGLRGMPSGYWATVIDGLDPEALTLDPALLACLRAARAFRRPPRSAIRCLWTPWPVLGTGPRLSRSLAPSTWLSPLIRSLAARGHSLR